MEFKLMEDARSPELQLLLYSYLEFDVHYINYGILFAPQGIYGVRQSRPRLSFYYLRSPDMEN